MLSVPTEVARKIVIDRIHPVTAWRHYYRISTTTLATLVSMSEPDILAIENSNHHLKKDVLHTLCNAFNIVPEALNVRFIPL